MNEIIQYFLGAVCPVFDNIRSDWRTIESLSCVCTSAVCVLSIVTAWVLLSMVKSCVIEFAKHISGGV